MANAPRTDTRSPAKDQFGHVGVTFPLADLAAPTVVTEGTFDATLVLPSVVGATAGTPGRLPGFGTANPDTGDYPNALLIDIKAGKGENRARTAQMTWKTLPGTILTEFSQDDEYLIPVTTTTQDVPATTAAEPSIVAGQHTTFSPVSAVESKKIVGNFDPTVMGNYYKTFPCQRELNVPQTLMAIQSTWDIAVGQGSSTESGSGFAVGSSAQLSISLQGSGEGSASVLADIAPIYAPRPHGPVPMLDLFFFLPSPVTLSALLTRATAIATAIYGTPTTVNQWPIFQTQEHTFMILGQKASVRQSASAHCSVSILAGSTPGQVNVSETTGKGTGYNVDMGSSVKAVKIDGCIHGAFSITGTTAIFATASSSASAVVNSGTNFPGASSTPDPLTFNAVGSIRPTSVAATPVAGLPSSGIGGFDPQVQPYKWGYDTCKISLFDWSILTNSVSIGHPQITLADFTGLTGAHFVQSAVQITNVAFAGLTGANFVTALSQVTTVDFSALNADKFVTALPQITTVDFTGQTGATYVTGGAGKGFLFPSTGSTAYGVWFNTGTETQPTIAGASAYIQVTCLSTDNSAQLATKIATAFAGHSSTWTTGTAGNVCTFTSVALVPQTDASDINSGAAISTTQAGSTNNPGLGFTLPTSATGTNAVIGIWFDTGTEVQPTIGGATTYLQVTITTSDTTSQIATALAGAINGAFSSLFTAAASGSVATMTSVAKVPQAEAADDNTTAAIATPQVGSAGGAGLGFVLPSTSPTVGTVGIWFATGTETQPTFNVVNSTYLKVTITPTSTAAAIATALSSAINASLSSLFSASASSSTTTINSVSTTTQGSAQDINSGVAITIAQYAGKSGGLYFNIYGYAGPSPTAIWFNTGTEVSPVSGTNIGITILTTYTASQLAAAVVAQVPSKVGGVWVLATIGSAAQFTAVANQVTTNAADVNSGAAISTTQAGMNPSI